MDQAEAAPLAAILEVKVIIHIDQKNSLVYWILILK